MKVDRLVSMIMILLEKRRVGALELAALFEVSPRTIYRDIDAINMAGVPVRSISGVGGGFEIMPDYKLDKMSFSSADLSAILMGLSGLSGMMRGDELAGALAKVKRFIPADRAKDIELRANQISIDLRPWTGNRNIQPHLALIKAALQQSSLLSFDYAAQHGHKTARTVEPYQLVLKNSHWYLQAYCLDRQDYRLFKLSRMSALQRLQTSFAPRAYEVPQLDISDILDARQTQIKLRIHKSILDRVLDVCADDQLSPDGGEHYLVDFPFIESDYHYDILLGFGRHCECLAPPRVRAELRRRIREMAALYD